MVDSHTRSVASVSCAALAHMAACCLALTASAVAYSAPPAGGDEKARYLDASTAEFDEWQPLVEHEPPWGDAKPFESFDQPKPADAAEPSFETALEECATGETQHAPWSLYGIPLERTSWLNRPFHVDWFVGPLLSDNPVSGAVDQSNELFGGVRFGWDFDPYWGLEWRFGWADPELTDLRSETVTTGNYFVSDFDFLYYPWGETKIRPYFLAGLGLSEIGSVREDGTGQEATLLGMPLGLGVQFPQTHWLAWRLEVIDNIAFGADGVDTMSNFAFTAGMEVRLGARPNSYWPWRSSRTIW